ncbi:ISAon1 family transposase N-terminal region protein [Bacteroides muris (ex Fokt et al. 2023)]|uniref:Transposase n=1 Tax=Bacteroides muris (ex Fokt et al. 2023) TaxID=2937417 RepID=A0A9X2NV12_9BACE|nr:hypothetical protein [Bacteroides muris (ex Fokt et al. 2023)]MCR6505764.1 hypothetical protein [Bacteroides muris (ex Fokt et al. 2023)]
MTSYDTLLVLARLILPVELLDCFDIVEIENDAKILTIHLDEQNLPPLSPTVHSLESKGFLPAVYIRDRKVTLCVRRRKWLDKETGSIICNTFELTAQGTRHSKEFASFLKGVLGEIPDYGPLS